MQISALLYAIIGLVDVALNLFLFAFLPNPFLLALVTVVVSVIIAFFDKENSLNNKIAKSLLFLLIALGLSAIFYWFPDFKISM